MNSELFEGLEALEREKRIPKEYMLEKIEAALIAACKKELGVANVRVDINEEKKEIKVYRQKEVVENVEDKATQISLEDAKKISRRYKLGSIAEEELKTKEFRRLSAQNAKQVIIQGIREAERSRQIREYEDRRGEVMSAIVIKVDDSTGDVVVDTGTSRSVLLKAEQIPGEVLRVDDRIKVCVTQVGTEARGPLVNLSRTTPDLIKRLFELEVPEIRDGTVVVKGLCREPGSRSKMAVWSRDENADAVGACIGNRGARINAVVEELAGEKIDVIPYSEDPAEYIAAALAPATVRSVTIEGDRQARVIVDADQLSLAIGKSGQNARLAARLTGYRVDIKSE